MNIIILGASGLIGNNCLMLLKSKSEINVIGTYFSYQTSNTSYFDTLNLDNPKNFDIDSFNPDVILHCGALTWVDYCEDHEEESYQKTVQSTLNAIELAKKFSAKLIYISTDYVFDGESGPYDEEATVNPLGIYAKHKLEAEQVVAAEIKDHLVLRVTNVFGDEERNKNFIARIVEQIYKNEKVELTLPYDQYATPVNACDVAKAVYLLIRDNKTGIYNIAGTDYVNRVHLAKRILKHFPDAEYGLKIISTVEMNQPSARPLNGGLVNNKFLNEYPDFEFSNVDDYLTKIKNDRS
ncbi:SDR family oxidoreductase [bacterium AH-315-C07]|nr:SDR family oxidoreductase [bacterium AH-315-C07]